MAFIDEEKQDEDESAGLRKKLIGRGIDAEILMPPDDVCMIRAEQDLIPVYDLDLFLDMFSKFAINKKIYLLNGNTEPHFVSMDGEEYFYEEVE